MNGTIEIVNGRGEVINEYNGTFNEAYRAYIVCSAFEKVYFDNREVCEYNLEVV